jgi:NAD(P)-dependent dehydrogenase (short-subunit alcohol dehydrogenase family)
MPGAGESVLPDPDRTQPWALREGRFAGRTAIVTSGGSGMGRVIARRFATLGAGVVVAGRHAETLAETKLVRARAEGAVETIDARETLVSRSA